MNFKGIPSLKGNHRGRFVSGVLPFISRLAVARETCTNTVVNGTSNSNLRFALAPKSFKPHPFAENQQSQPATSSPFLAKSRREGSAWVPESQDLACRPCTGPVHVGSRVKQTCVGMSFFRGPPKKKIDLGCPFGGPLKPAPNGYLQKRQMHTVHGCKIHVAPRNETMVSSIHSMCVCVCVFCVGTPLWVGFEGKFKGRPPSWGSPKTDTPMLPCSTAT